MRELPAFLVLGLLLVACGGSAPPPEAPAPEEPPEQPAPVLTPASAEPPVDEAPKEEPKPAAVEPQFQEGMSVEDAIKAVPQGAERSNMDPETLGKPLQEFSLYEPCKPGSAHFKLRVAVWDGKVVGADVTTTPKSDQLTACIKEQLKTVTWKAKVRSLNIVEYAF
jgi:hypothetical protein